MTDAAVNEGLAVVAASVVAALGKVQSAAGADVAAHAAQLMIGLATTHLLASHGPIAARSALISAYADLDAAIGEQNCGSGVLS
jgi:hypothetical protein